VDVDQLNEFAERWPTWFDLTGDITRTAMPGGFAGIGEDWRQLLWELYVELEPHVEAMNRELAGQEPDVSFEVMQVRRTPVY
jgi:hypothetical protein